MPKFSEEDFREKVREILNDYKVLYNNAASGLIDDILDRINSGIPISKSVEQALKSTNFQGTYDDAVVNAVYQAACAGFGVLPSMVTSNSEKTIKNKLLSDSWAPDKMDLSYRLHTLDVRNTVVQTIRSSMQKAEAVNEIANNLYDGYNSGKGVLNRTTDIPNDLKRLKQLSLRAVNGDKAAVQEVYAKADNLQKYSQNLKTKNLQAAYKELIDACKSLNEKAIKNAARVALEEKTRYLAERIARTEATRAWFDGYIAERQDDSDIWGYKWVLSSRHSRVPFDQCDVCANMDIGFGKGVYPKNKVPKIPRHPHCMCMLEDVFEWEVEDKSKDIDPDGARKYLNSLGKNQKINLFGYDGYKAYEHGGDWQRLLIGWDGFNNPISRLSKDDFKLKNDEYNGKISINIKEYGEAVIPLAKLTSYALNPEKDKDKALAFEKALGYNLKNVNKLIDNVKNNINKFEIVHKPDNGYGERFHILMNLLGENGKHANVLSAWIKDKRNDEVRLTSMYVKSGKK